MTGQITREKFVVRIPPNLKDWIEAEAVRNGCSQNSEIVRAIVERRERLAVGSTRADPRSSIPSDTQFGARS
jgi:hypothetical protein